MKHSSDAVRTVKGDGRAQAKDVQDDVEEIDEERLPLVEANPRKEHLEIQREICYACS